MTSIHWSSRVQGRGQGGREYEIRLADDQRSWEPRVRVGGEAALTLVGIPRAPITMVAAARLAERYERDAQSRELATRADDREPDEESESERLARQLAEADLGLIHALRVARQELKLTRLELATRLGASESTVAAFEDGRAEPTLSMVRRFAHALGVLVEHQVTPRAAAQ